MNYMDAFVKLLNQHYELYEYKIKDEKVIFQIRSMTSEFEYPYCGTIAMRTHSIY